MTVIHPVVQSGGGKKVIEIFSGNSHDVQPFKAL